MPPPGEASHLDALYRMMQYTNFMSTYANSTPYPRACAALTILSTEMYCKVQVAELMQSLTVPLLGKELSIMRLDFPLPRFLGMAPNQLICRP